MSNNLIATIYLIVFALVWAGFLVKLSVDVHLGQAGDDYFPMIFGGFMVGVFWPIAAAILGIYGAGSVIVPAIHHGIGRFVPNRVSVTIVPPDPILEAARREVEAIAPKGED